MSVRAYKVVEIIKNEEPSFNLWHSEKLMDFLEDNGFYDRLVEGEGLTEISVEVLEEAIKKKKKLEIDEETEKLIKEDIAEAKKFGDNYIEYYCY